MGHAATNVEPRTAQLIDMMQCGYLTMVTDSEKGGIFTLSTDVAATIILDHDNQTLRLGFPEEMKDVANGLWVSWFSTDNAVVLVGSQPGKEFGFELHIPIPAALASNLSRTHQSLTIGVLSINEQCILSDISSVCSVKHR